MFLKFFVREAKIFCSSSVLTLNTVSKPDLKRMRNTRASVLEYNPLHCLKPFNQISIFGIFL